ncbi:MAG: hypothetical protein Fur0018_13830 [Anaerolineales bacterium]
MPENPASDPLHSVRRILLVEERERLQRLEARLESLQTETQQAIANLEAEIAALREHIRQEEAALQQGIARLEAHTTPDALAESLSPVMSRMVRQTIHNSKEEMAEALGPVMGEAIRVQIRDSRADMVEAIFPIIGETVQRAIAEFAREFQRNIDARLQSFRNRNLLRTVTARLRGVSPAELAMRDALPFRIQEIFLVQHGSGLLMAHSHPGSAEITDTDLVSAMLTAIRDFVRDSFGEEGENAELDEVQYGDERIIVQSGRYAYLAVVVEGVEPEGFRARLRQFVSELHVRHGEVLRDFEGDPATLPNLQALLAQLVLDLGGEEPGPSPMTPVQRWMLAGGLAGLLFFIGLACFYLRFTLALLPVAFPHSTPTATATHTPLPTSTATPTLTPSPTATASSTPTFVPTATPTWTPTLTPSPQPTDTPTPPPTGEMTGHVWARTAPDGTAPLLEIIVAGTPVEVRAQFGLWVQIRWQGKDGNTLEGWVPLRWVDIPQGIPAFLVTPTVSP